ncbi:MAG: hypothetical protein ABIO49_10770 [Dokdonella sp.]
MATASAALRPPAPCGALQAGQRYAFVAREAGVSRNARDIQSIDLLSYMEIR